MIIDCISDLHGFYPELDGGDLLVIAGDLTARDMSHERVQFLKWLADQDYRKKIWIAGNHDNSLVGLKFDPTRPDAAEYLCDSGTEFEGLKIWGSPWTSWFPQINPHCMAFTKKTERELQEKWDLIPNNIDILVTHSPPYAILDHFYEWGDLDKPKYVGSPGLREKIENIKPRIHVFGHIHENGGKQLLKGQFGDPNTVCVNASIVNEKYEHVNKPVRIEL